jgi:hypothetical protein
VTEPSVAPPSAPEPTPVRLGEPEAVASPDAPPADEADPPTGRDESKGD